MVVPHVVVPAGGEAEARTMAEVQRLPEPAFLQRYAGAIDATGTTGAGIGRLIAAGGGYYTFVLQLNADFLSRFSPALTSFGYTVTFSVNGQRAKGLFAGDMKFRPANEHIHSKQRIQGRSYTMVGSRKTFIINTGDVLQLSILDYLVDPIYRVRAPVWGTMTCVV